jgi:rhamnose transport system substrate-binding protein
VARFTEFLFVFPNERCPMLLTRGRRVKRVAMIATALAIVTAGTAVAASSVGSLKKGLTVFYIPKDTLNPYEVIADRGGKIALTQMGSKQVVQSGTKDTAAAQLPAVQTAIQTGANAIVIAGNDPAALCPQLKQAMAKGVAVVTFDSDTNCRQLFINQADTETIGRSQIQELGKEMGYKGEFAILSAASTATNQNAWIKYMKLELKLPKYKNMKLVKIYYGNDDPAESLQATESMLQAYPNLKGIESPTTVGISSAAQYLSNSKYKGKVVLQGLGLPSQMKKYLKNNTLKNFALWNPEDLGYLAAYAAASLASGDIKGKVGESFKAGKLGTYKIIKGAGGPEVILGPPFLFTKKNVDKFKF